MDSSVNPLETLKQEYMVSVKNQFKDVDIAQVWKSSKEFVTLYHGTSSYFLNDILTNGILPRNLTEHHNWEKAPSNEDIIYLTNKWHYNYAYHTTETLLEKKYGEEWHKISEAQWWLTLNPVPIYVECKVPKELLIADEDIFYSNFMRAKIKSCVRQNKPLSLTWDESLSQYGTVGVFGGIIPSAIETFTVLADGRLRLELMDEDKTYFKEVKKWNKGYGKGKLKKEDLLKIEKKYERIGKFNVKQIPKGLIITEFGMSPSKEFVLNMCSPEDYSKQFRVLEKF